MVSTRTLLRYVVVTGRPGVGKTTLVLRVTERLRNEGISVKGFVCPEVRRAGRRVGFLIKSIDGDEEGWLAHITACIGGPRVGKYTVCPEAGIIAQSIVERALKEADIIVIDEIGPMELKHPQIRRSILMALSSGKPGLYVVHRRLNDPQVLPILRKHGKWFIVTEENRDTLAQDVYREVKSIIESNKE